MSTSKAFICTLLCAFTTVTLAEPPGQPVEREKAVMLYFSKSFGGPKQKQAPLSFGFKLQQSSPFGAMRPIALMDARYSFGGRKTFSLAGFPAFDSTQGSSDDSSTSSTVSSADMSHKHPGWTAAMIALAVFGAMCITENVFCEDNGRRSPGESPGLGD